MESWEVMGMRVGKVLMFLALGGILLVGVALYGCSNGLLDGGEESRWDLPTTPAVSLHDKVGVLRRERSLRPIGHRDVPRFTENSKENIHKLEISDAV